MSLEDELLDLVDDKDQVIGTILRSEYQNMVDQKLGYIRAVDMFIVNSEGKLWIPKRTANKRIAPNGLDYSVGGHVDSGETYMQALVRETEEELNIKLNPAHLELVKKFAPASTAYFRSVYLYKSDEMPNFNPNDFVSAEWMTPSELLQKLAAGTTAKESIRETVVAIF